MEIRPCKIIHSLMHGFQDMVQVDPRTKVTPVEEDPVSIQVIFRSH